MKNLNIIFAAVLFALFALTSCQKENLEEMLDTTENLEIIDEITETTSSELDEEETTTIAEANSRSSKGVGSNVAAYRWTSGWTTAEFFKVGSKNFLFLLKEKGTSGSDKRIKIFEMKSNGKVGDLVTEYRFSEGWTTAEFYTVGSRTYLLTMKERGRSNSGHNIKIYPIRSNGKIGNSIAGYTFSEGWTTAEFYKVGSANYLFLLKERGQSNSGHRAKIFKVKSNGKIGSLVMEQNFSAGWTSAEFYTIGSKTYLFLLKERGQSNSGHRAKIFQMRSNGKIGSLVMERDFSAGWTSAEFYKVGSKTYLFLLKERGLSGSGYRSKIYEMRSNGKIGSLVDQESFSAGWATAELCTIGSRTYLLLLKENGLSGSGHRAKIYRMKG